MPVKGLTEAEDQYLTRLSGKILRQQPHMDLMERYFDAEQRLKHIGLAVPPELRMFETIVNVPRIAVREPVNRQSIRAWQRSGQTGPDPALQAALDANNMWSHFPLVSQDVRVYGHSFISVLTNTEDPGMPLIVGESPRNLAVDVDPQKRRIRAAVRRWRDSWLGVQMATLYTPERTVWLQLTASGWEITDVDPHGLGAVPIVLLLNQAKTGKWRGRSEMADVITKTDAIARLITNMQVGAETHALPDKWAVGVTKGDFVDTDGRPLPTWEAYFTAIKAAANKDAKFGQFQAGDLKNFTDAVNNLLAWCAAELGLPTRYAGQQEVNPAAEGAIRADESRLIKNVERMNLSDGDSLSWVAALHERFRTGVWPDRNSIRTLWHDPATPTKAQTADAAVKLFQSGVLPREGVWDELGYDEATKMRLRGYFQREAAEAAANPYLDLLAAKDAHAAQVQDAAQAAQGVQAGQVVAGDAAAAATVGA